MKVLVLSSSHFDRFLELCPTFRDMFSMASSAFTKMNKLDGLGDAVSNVQGIKEFCDAKGHTVKINIARPPIDAQVKEKLKQQKRSETVDDDEIEPGAPAAAVGVAPPLPASAPAPEPLPPEAKKDGSLWNLVPRHADSLESDKLADALPIKLFARPGMQRRGSRLAGVMNDLTANAPKGSTVLGARGSEADPLGLAPNPKSPPLMKGLSDLCLHAPDF